MLGRFHANDPKNNAHGAVFFALKSKEQPGLRYVDMCDIHRLCIVVQLVRAGWPVGALLLQLKRSGLGGRKVHEAMQKINKVC